MSTTNPVTIYALDVIERATKSGAQFALLDLTGVAVNLFAFNWLILGGAFGGGFVLSILTSLASLPVGGNSTASIVKEIAAVSSDALAPIETTPVENTSEPVLVPPFIATSGGVPGDTAVTATASAGSVTVGQNTDAYGNPVTVG